MIKLFFIIVLIGILVVSIWGYGWYKGKTAPSNIDTSTTNKGEAVAYFAGGCFWCTESDYEKLPEVIDVVSGYMGGGVEEPSYNQVSSGDTGHREMIKVTYDPTKTNYHDLVLYLLKHTDPTDNEGSFYDRGYQYTSAVYYQTDEEKSIAEGVIKQVEERKIFDKPISTSIEKAGAFWLAEEYHQNYYKKNPIRYKYYREGSG